LKTRIEVRLRNHSKTPLPVSVLADGSQHVAMGHRQVATLPAHGSHVARVTAQVAAEIPDADLVPGPRLPRVRATLVLDGSALELTAGLRPRAGIEVATEPAVVALVPGVRRDVQLVLRNRTAGPGTA